MNNNIAILFSDFGPYHVARIEALADALQKQGDHLFAYRFSEASPIYGWKPATPSNATVITLGTANPSGAAASLAMARAFGKSLRKNKIKAAFMPSYSPLPNMLCVLSARLAGTRLVLMNESWRLTERASFLGKAAKHCLVRLFSSALVGGTPQKQFACDYGQDPAKVFLGYDAVDTAYYEQQSAQWKQAPATTLPIPHLPARYFLNLGRFVFKKNIPSLVRAYAGLLKRYPALDIALVLVGEGDEEPALRKLVAELQVPMRDGASAGSGETAGIVFYPFQQVDKTPLFFSRCEAFILPSMYEEWGLVVNEAMASSTAVIVSENVGCASDLVVDGINGFKFNPASVEQLEGILEKFVQDPGLAARLGAAGLQHIREWGPSRFAGGGINALAAALA